MVGVATGSGGEGLNVLQHVLESLRGGRLSMAEGNSDPAIQAERLELQPDEAETVIIEEDEDTWCVLGASEAVASDEAGAIEAAQSQGWGSEGITIDTIPPLRWAP